MNRRQFCFTMDDNIRFLKELTEGSYESLFHHPYPAMLRRLHQTFGLKVQLNLFYQMKDFDLSQMTDRYRSEWEENAHWLKLSFHSRLENVDPYRESGYEEVYADCAAVHREICRFASPAALANTTTLHYCLATSEGLRALADCGVQGLLGLYGSRELPRVSYQTAEPDCNRIREGETVWQDGVAYAAIDLILNLYPREELLPRLKSFLERPLVKVMIHEQYFYPDYRRYQADFAQKLEDVFSELAARGYESVFFEDTLKAP